MVIIFRRTKTATISEIVAVLMKIVFMYYEGGYSSSSGSWLFKIRSRDWLRFARPSLFGVPLQEISNHLSVFVTDFVLHVYW